MTPAGESGRGRALVGHIDGGARGNPGPAGYGVHIEEERPEAAGRGPAVELYGFVGVTTNNIAEYAALLALLEYAVTIRPASLRILSDSELLVRQMEGRYRVKDSRLKVLHAAARRLVAALPRVTLEHVRREANKEADALANRAMDRRDSSGALPGALRGVLQGPSQPDLL